MRSQAFLLVMASHAILLTEFAAAQFPHLTSRWEQTISVNGTGELQREPDTAEIEVGVVTAADTAAAAVQGNNEKMRALLKVLKERDIAEEDIQTSNFQVAPRREIPEPREREQPPAIIGYEVTNQVHIRVRKLPVLGEVLDAATAQGANQIHGIQFSISDRGEFENQALRKALANARQKAQTLAAEADVQLGRVVSISESSFDFPRPMMGRAMQAQMADSVPVSPGSMTVRAGVSVTYAIGRDEDDEADETVEAEESDEAEAEQEQDDRR